MTVTYQPIVQIDATLFSLSFTTDQPLPATLRVYREGTQINTIVTTSGKATVLLTIGVGESPFVEVLDMACQNPSIAFPGHMTLNWLSISGATSYTVQEFVGAAWTTRQTILDDGSGVFTWLTGWLTDVTNHQFQIVPVDGSGTSGTPIGFSAIMVRHPDSPNPGYTYSNSTHQLTITGP